MKNSACEKLNVRGMQYNIRHWGPSTSPILFFLHGWMDTSATFQFIVDELKNDWHIIAPDWRGYGDSEMLDRPYWFPDYYADLDVIIDHFSPNKPVCLVGHSMGANIASTYSSIRPERVEKLVMLDFLGLKPDTSISAPIQLRSWLDAAIIKPPVKCYKDVTSISKKLAISNPRITRDQADYLASTLSRENADGTFRLACDPWHKVASPYVYHIEDAKASWRHIEASVLEVIAEEGYVMARFGNAGLQYEALASCFRNYRSVTIPDAGHNVHHDQPRLVARELEKFLLAK